MTEHLISKTDLRNTTWRESELSDLADKHVRLKVESFALTANNVTYARFGKEMQYWEFFPSGNDTMGRVPVWGFATVTESNAEGVAVGKRVYGYLPISTHFDVQPSRVSPQSFLDGAPHRQGLAPIYNTYVFTDADSSYDAALEAQQMLFRPLFTTGWMIDDSLMEAAEDVPETVVISSASSKTALALAHCLKTRGGVDTVALTSPGNKDFVEGTGLYGRVRTYDDVDRLHARGLTAFVDFLGRPSLTSDIHNALRDRLFRSMVIGVTDWEATRAALTLPDPQPEIFFVPTYAAERAKQIGPDVLNAKLNASLTSFYTISKDFVTPVFGKGVDAIDNVWTETVEAKASPAEGHVLSF